MPVADPAAPVTISQYVLKVASRCDLACDHCYVYEHADQSWRSKPKVIAPDVVQLAARRIAAHAATYNLPAVRVVLHGGEPLLLGRDGTRAVLSALTARIGPVTRLDLRMHTNAVQLDERWCDLLASYQVRVGVSLDGDRAANDLHRRYADGRSSHAQVRRALGLLRQPRYRELYAGLLCTIDVTTNPEVVYRALAAEQPPVLDLLLPHATWDSPPPRPGDLPHPYADWLLAVYRCWCRDGRPMPIRLFDSIWSAVRGGPSYTEAIGLDPVNILVIDTDGAWEQADSLKTAYDGAPGTGMDVRSHSVDDVARHHGLVARRSGLAVLCPTCRDCTVVQVCGGGLYAHRYRTGTGFANPSVYCADLKDLIQQIVATSREAPMGGTQSAPLPVHRLPPGAFDALAAGPGTPAAVGALAQLRLSQVRALVAAVAESRPARPDNPMLASAATAGWDLLCALDAASPGAVADTFASPYVPVWAMRCLHPGPDADRELDRAHLAGLALAAALHAEVAADLPLPVRDGLAHVPSIGALRVSASAGRTVRVRFDPGRHVLSAGDPFSWLTVRQVTGPSLRFAVEDLDPFRDCQQWPATGRLTRQDWLALRQAVHAAGSTLARIAPAYAGVLSAGLRAVVPLLPAPSGPRSGTSRHAFGGMAFSPATSPAAIADMLVHEFQHVKLFALTDLYDLVDMTSTRRLEVPWREDPRPPEGVLHGVYAHLGLAQLSLARGEAGRAAWQQYSTWVRRACEALYQTTALTPDGERFVAGITTAIEAGHRG